VLLARSLKDTFITGVISGTMATATIRWCHGFFNASTATVPRTGTSALVTRLGVVTRSST